MIRWNREKKFSKVKSSTLFTVSKMLQNLSTLSQAKAEQSKITENLRALMELPAEKCSINLRLLFLCIRGRISFPKLIFLHWS